MMMRMLACRMGQKMKPHDDAETETPKSGFVYLAVSPACPEIVKIGHTTCRPEERAKDFSQGTGVPAPWSVVYKKYVSNCVEVETQVHLRLQIHRRNPNREFFWVSVDEARQVLDEVVQAQDSIEILPSLQKEWGLQLRPNLVSVRFVYADNKYHLEVLRRVGRNLKDLRTDRVSLSAKNRKTGTTFSTNDPVSKCADAFCRDLETHPLTLDCGNLLFTRSAWNEISNTLNLFDQPRIEQLQHLLAACDDEDGPHVLTVVDRGYYGCFVTIWTRAEIMEWQESEKKQRATYRLQERRLWKSEWYYRYPTWPAGFGYVGAEASQNLRWVKVLFARLLKDSENLSHGLIQWYGHP
jgi:hypothetical protein